MKTISQNNITPYQLKMPLEISKIIEISDPVYTFCEVMDHIDLNKYLAVKESKALSEIRVLNCATGIHITNQCVFMPFLTCKYSS